MIINLESPPEEIISVHEVLLKMGSMEPVAMIASLKLTEDSLEGLIISLEEKSQLPESDLHYYLGMITHWRKIEEGYISYPDFTIVSWDETKNEFMFREVGN